MARLPYLDEADLPADQRDLLARPINLFRELVHSPNAARQLMNLGQWIRHESVLDPRPRELAILTVGYLTRAPYEYSHHLKIGQDFGLSKQDLRSLPNYLEGQEARELAEVDRSVIDCARQLTQGNEIDDGTYAKLEAVFQSEDLVDLVVTISFYNWVVRLLGAFRIDVEPAYQAYLDEFPLPGNKAAGAV